MIIIIMIVIVVVLLLIILIIINIKITTTSTTKAYHLDLFRKIEIISWSKLETQNKNAIHNIF